MAWVAYLNWYMLLHHVYLIYLAVIVFIKVRVSFTTQKLENCRLLKSIAKCNSSVKNNDNSKLILWNF